MLRQRHKWIKKRFGNISENILENIEDADDIVWPDIVREYEVKGNILTYRMLADIEKTAERIAEIFKNGADEMVGNSEIEWHQNEEEIIKKVKAGDWNFYGCYLGEKLIAAESMRIIRGDRIMEWVWGCVDPVYRGKGVWQYIGIYNDLLVKMSGAQVGSVSVVTTHKYSQMAAEQVGYTPMGCFIGKRFYGGSDNRYYRHTLIHYVKLYGDTSSKCLQDFESMQLTESAAEIVNFVKKLWEKNKQNIQQDKNTG